LFPWIFHLRYVELMNEVHVSSWEELSRRAARSVQSTIGWIFWDPGAVARYEQSGLAAGLGYIAARGAPFAGAGPSALTSALGSISPLGIAILFDLLTTTEGWLNIWELRNEAVLEGLRSYAPAIVDALHEFSDDVWKVVGELPLAGRPFCASHLDLPRQSDPLLHAWHGVNFIREWRGDTHWAIVAGHSLNGQEASILHNAWLGYEGDWLSASRGNSPQDIDAAWKSLALKGLAEGRTVNKTGLDLRQLIEDETDRATEVPWRLLGWQRSLEFIQYFEPPSELLLQRVNETAGIQYQPASRLQGRDRL